MLNIAFCVVCLSCLMSEVKLQNSTEKDISNDMNDTITTVSSIFNVSAEEIFDTSDSKSKMEDLMFTDTTEKNSLTSTSPFLARRVSPVDTTTIPPSATTEVELTTISVLQKWKKFEKITKDFAGKSVKNLLPYLMANSGKFNLSVSCMRNALKFISALKNIKTWAFSFIDSSGKIMDGLLSGTMAAIGDYDQCLDIKAIDERRGKNYGQVMFTGKYCSIDVKPPLPPKKSFYKLDEVVEELKNFSQGSSIISEAAKAAHFFNFISLRLGICVPSGCQVSDIQQIANSVAEPIYWSAVVKRCEVKEENEYTPLIIAVMTSMCFFGFLMLIGSLIELYHIQVQRKIESLPLQFFACFSLITNFKKLFNTKSSSDDNLACFHGLKFLSISWIIVGHTYLNINYQVFRGLKRAMEYREDFFFQAVINASVAVDTFFFLGGFLVCYATVKISRTTKLPFNFPLYVMHRLIRLLPLYVMVIIFVFLAPILGSGPIWKDMITKPLTDCYNNWWTNILFINNFYHSDAICLPQSWYISCDMQLYLAALIVVLPLLRWPRIGIFLGILGILASVIGTSAMTYLLNYPPTMLFVHPDPDERILYWSNAYFKPYSHAGPYCIGLLVGYLLVTKPKLQLPLVVRIMGWCLAIICNVAVLYGAYEWNLGRDPTLVETLLYSGLHRIAWTYGIAWITINCAIGQGGIVNYILTWKCWIPLSRLTYAAYLIHPIVQIAAIGHVRMRPMATHTMAVWVYFGHLMITFGSSFCASMLVEAPFMGLEKLILSRLKVTSQVMENRKNITSDANGVNGEITPLPEEPAINGHARNVSRL